jgi:transposase
MKYSYSIRLEMVKLVLGKGYSLREAARLIYCDKKVIHHLVAHYQAHGEDGLHLKKAAMMEHLSYP